ncbi:MAG: hypothetical protein KDI19_15600, partial [Pseudomonadales bacterium]|nr:hypothetical protein [Pseudomonadales bacterium]
QARYMRVPADDDFGTSQSFSVSYDDDNIYWSVAADVDMRKNDQAAARTVVYDSVRTVTRFQVEKWRVGILLQTSRRGDIAGSDWEPGFVASLGRSFAAFDISAQYGQSDILVPGGRQTLLGISHHVARHLRLYAIASVYDSDSGNSEALSLGAEYKFSASLR